MSGFLTNIRDAAVGDIERLETAEVRDVRQSQVRHDVAGKRQSL